MYLVDTNIWLERLLDQARAGEVGDFLQNTPSEHLYMTDFTLHSIGVVLCRLKQLEALGRFVQDIFLDGAVSLLRLEPEDTPLLIELMATLALDFDDAYQYLTAEKNHLVLVSLDQDFDGTPLGRKAPGDLV